MEKRCAIQAGPAADRKTVFMGVFIVSLIALVVGCGTSASDTEMENVSFRLKRLETRMAAIELNNDACSDKNTQVEEFMADIERRQADLIRSISKLEKQLQTGVLRVEKTTEIPTTTPLKKDNTPSAPVENDATGQPRYHHVQKGETVYSISQIYKLAPADLKELNALESDVIVPGQKLRVK